MQKTQLLLKAKTLLSEKGIEETNSGYYELLFLSMRALGSNLQEAVKIILALSREAQIKIDCTSVLNLFFKEGFQPPELMSISSQGNLPNLIAIESLSRFPENFEDFKHIQVKIRQELINRNA